MGAAGNYSTKDPMVSADTILIVDSEDSSKVKRATADTVVEAAGVNVFGVSFFFPGTYEASQVLASFKPKVAFTVAAGSSAIAIDLTDGANPSATAVISFKKNGTEWASASIATDGTATITNTSGASFTTSDRFSIVAPTTADTTLEGMSASLLATRA